MVLSAIALLTIAHFDESKPMTRRQNTIAFLLCLLPIGSAIAQPPAACFQQGSVSSATAGKNFLNVALGCYQWRMTYTATGFSALSVQLESAPNVAGSPGSWTAFSGSSVVTDGTNPATSATAGTIGVHSAAAFVRINVTSATGTGSLTWQLYGANSTLPLIGAAAASTVINGMPATNVSYPVVRGQNLATGNTDLYTVPAGKRLLVMAGGGVNTSAASVTWYAEIKTGGAYFMGFINPAAVAAGANTAATSSAFIFEAGESFSVNTTGPGLNVFFAAVQFDNTSPFFMARKVGLVTGPNTIYTVPAGHSAIVLAASGAFSWTNASIITVSALAVAPGLITACVVPAGGSATCAANSINEVGFVTGAALNTGRINLPGIVMNAGDFIVLNVATGDPTQLAWLPVLQL
jgi:hypothetical protein